MTLPLRCSLAVLLLLVSASILGCAEPRSPADLAIQAHPESWTEPASENFHGTRVAERGTSGCTSCHGEDHRGEKRAPSCFDCHAHPEEWLVSASDDFHGRAIAAGERCEACHGEDLRGGWAETSCFTCHPGPSGHPQGWLSPPSTSFHGTRVRNESATACAACHGADLRGGTVAEPSCYEPCHDGPGGHPSGWVSRSSPPFHGATVNAEGTSDCVDCHGAALDGGWSQVSCANACHSSASGHPSGWMTPDTAGFHGQALIDLSGYDTCKPCHGENVDGGWSNTSCYNVCHDGPGGHPTDWYNLGGPQTHDDAYFTEPPGYCEQCHDGASGDWSGIACTDCH